MTMRPALRTLMAPAIARGMQTVHFNVSRKAALVSSADAYLRTRHAHNPGQRRAS